MTHPKQPSRSAAVPATFVVRCSTCSASLPARPGCFARNDVRPSTSAFSLIEVVVAVALFAMAATVLSSSFVNALLAREKSQSNALRNADIQAVRMQLLLEPNRDDAESGGRYPTLNNGEATWSAEIEPTNVVDLFHVNFFVEFLEPEEGQSPAYQETLYLLRPTWSESDKRSKLLEDKRQALEDARDFGEF